MIRHLARVTLAAAALLLSGAVGFAQKTYVQESLASDAIRLEAQIKTQAGTPAPGRSAQQYRRDADAALRADPRRALAYLTAAIALEPANGSHWLAFARAARAIEPRDWNERYRLQEQMTAAAYGAYQRATTRADEAAALAALGDMYAAREIWRPSLNSYRASLALSDDARVRQVYETLRESHGFRIIDSKVDSDSASPRVCFVFSEPLATGKVDFAPYVAVSGAANAAVSVEAEQLCVDGLKHSERYAFVLRQGLPSSVGESLLKSADYEIYVRDRAPQVRFTGRNYVLPRTGQEGIPVVSVNTSKVDLDVVRIGDRGLLPTLRSEDFLSQLSGYAASSLATEKGSKIWSGTLDTASDLNRDVVTAFPVLEAVGSLEPGVYVMTARPHREGAAPNGDDDPSATQWFVVSDLGLTALKGIDGVHVLVRSLATAEPMAKVEVRLVARNNEVLATKATDEAGHAIFDPGLARGEGGLAPGLVVAAVGTDYGFLDLNTSAFDLSDRGVKGRSIEGAVDAYLYTERGVYRTGETVFATALLRDIKGSAIAGVALTLVVKRPDGVEYRRANIEDQGLGGRVLALPILPGAMRGTWRISAYTDPKGASVGETSFLVEDYVPERLELTLTPRQAALRPGEPAQIDLSARYLFGAPGANLDVTGDVVVGMNTESGIKGLDGFSVGLDDETVEASTVEIEQEIKTDGQGRAALQLPVQEVAAPHPMKASFAIRVAEPGGRGIERAVTVPILPAGPVVGVKKLFGGNLAEGANAGFDVVLARPDGTRISGTGVTWTLARIEKRYQWYNADGRWGFEPVRTTRRVADGRIDISQAAAARIATPVSWGTYRLDVRAPDLGATAQTSITFTVGWSGDQSAETPDLLEINLDKASYRAGDSLQIRLRPRFAGKATIAVVSDKVHELRVVDVAADGTSVTIPVRPEWGAGAYAVAFAHRPLDQAAKRLPGRALGLAWFEVDREAHALQVTLDAPAQIRPRGTLRLPIKVAGLNAGEEARLTVAAVDVGILNLTRYVPPDAMGHFFGQRQLSTEIRDLYGYLIDGMQGTRGAIRSGGDEDGEKLEGSPPTQEPLALFSGIVRVAPDGTAEANFDIPAFNGTARIMAVAWTKDRVGGAVADTVIRDPVVLAGTLPRFLSVGDQSRFHIQVDNVEGPAGEYAVDLDIRGPIIVPADALRSTLRLERGGRGALTIPVTAAGPGTAIIDAKLSGGGFAGAQSFAVRIEPGSSALLNRTVRQLDPGASFTVSSDLLTDILPGTGAVSLSASPLASLDVPGLLRALDRYPYGCSEQIVSRAMPLLYVNRLASEDALAFDKGADERVREAIERVLSRQDSNGSFGLWSVGGDDIWLDAYVTDFLTRARERGFAVPQLAFNLALDRLRNMLVNTTNVEENGAGLAYAAYVLARNGRPVMGDLRYLADTKLSGFPTPLARGQVAAALALLGDRGRAQTAFAAAVERLRADSDTGSYRDDYGSRLRDGAGLMALASEAGGPRELIRLIGNVIETETARGRTTSTQENAWMVLAAQALQRDAELIGLSVDGTAHRGAYYRTIRDTDLSQRSTTIANSGADPVRVVVSVSGNPISPEPPLSRGYVVERSYYKLDGTPADVARARQNDRFVTVLKVTENVAQAARLLLVDRLPAGLEIDNPQLVDTDTFEALSWLKRDVEPTHAEYRDDRFVAALDRAPSQPATFTLAYVVRAVAPGRYVHPPATVEDMYRPERFGRTASGIVEVSPRP